MHVAALGSEPTERSSPKGGGRVPVDRAALTVVLSCTNVRAWWQGSTEVSLPFFTSCSNTVREGTMSVTDKLKETKDKLKDKVKGRRDKMSASAHEHTEKAGGLFHKAKDAVRTEAQHETSESKRIGKDIREKVEGKPGEAKEPFNTH